MNMKKNHKILTIFLCLIMFFMAGCGDGGFGVGSGGEGVPINLDGVKVMRKPAEYSISEIVGEENSEYFYNLLSQGVMRLLYWTYSYGLEIEPGISYNENITAGTALENIFNDTNTDKYFYYDSIRYSIESITVNNVDNVLEITLDKGSAWNFGFDNYYMLDESVSGFPTLALVNNDYDILSTTYIDNVNILNINASYMTYTDDIYGTPDPYSDIYYGEDFRNDAGILMYGNSPYYQEYVAGEPVTTLNTYQDALEYVTYLFVLGYDYENEDGGVNSENAPYFDLQVSYNLETVELNGNSLRLNVPSVTVARTPSGSTKVPISEALDEIKERYNVLGTYIGVTDENKEQLVRFILDYVIGLDDGETGDYSFNLRVIDDIGGGGEVTSSRNVEVNRDYENVVRNIVDVACTEVRIGGSEGDGEVFIDRAYPISEIVDYKNDYFYTQWYDENGDVSDGELLGHVEEAEYQAMSLILPEDEIGYFLTDVYLCFEYYDDDPNDDSSLIYDEANGLTLNVGINYYDSQGNILYSSEPALKNVKYGKLMADADYHAGIDPDIRNVFFTTGDDVTSDDMYGPVFSQIEKIPLRMQFDNNIDDGVLNAELNGEEINEYEHVIQITGNSPAREYYMMNESSSYGQYATFNPDMFAGKTDYIEIYFDVLKDSADINKNYNFKVGMFWVSTDSYMKDDPDYVGALSMSFLDDIDLVKSRKF